MKENTTTTTTEKVNLGAFKSKKESAVQKEVKTNLSSFTKIPTESRSIAEVMGLKRMNFKFSSDRTRVVLSQENLRNVPADVIDKIASGEASVEDNNTIVFEANDNVSAASLHSMFYAGKNDDVKTRAASYGFFVNPKSKDVSFFAVQGGSCKNLELGKVK